MARTRDEAHDNIARFFESVAAAVADNGGVFMDDGLSSHEAQTIIRVCRRLAKERRQKADGIRTAE